MTFQYLHKLNKCITKILRRLLLSIWLFWYLLSFISFSLLSIYYWASWGHAPQLILVSIYAKYRPVFTANVPPLSYTASIPCYFTIILRFAIRSSDHVVGSFERYLFGLQIKFFTPTKYRVKIQLTNKCSGSIMGLWKQKITAVPEGGNPQAPAQVNSPPTQRIKSAPLG